MTDKYDGLTRRQWANRVVDCNDKFDKAALIKHYTAKQLGNFHEEGGKIQLTKRAQIKNSRQNPRQSARQNSRQGGCEQILPPLPH